MIKVFACGAASTRPDMDMLGLGAQPGSRGVRQGRIDSHWGLPSSFHMSHGGDVSSGSSRRSRKAQKARTPQEADPQQNTAGIASMTRIPTRVSGTTPSRASQKTPSFINGLQTVVSNIARVSTIQVGNTAVKVEDEAFVLPMLDHFGWSRSVLGSSTYHDQHANQNEKCQPTSPDCNGRMLLTDNIIPCLFPVCSLDSNSLTYHPSSLWRRGTPRRGGTWQGGRWWGRVWRWCWRRRKWWRWR